MIYFILVTGTPKSLVFEIIACVIIPLNSILNPIFYSSLFDKIIALPKYLRNSPRKEEGATPQVPISRLRFLLGT